MVNESADHSCVSARCTAYRILLDSQLITCVGYCWLTVVTDRVSWLAYDTRPLSMYQKTL